MNKINLKRYAADSSNKQTWAAVLTATQDQINRGADGFLFSVKRLTSTDSPYTMNVNDSILICDTTGGSITINLLPAQEWEEKTLIVKKIIAANTVTVTPNGSETIDGAASSPITTQYIALKYAPQGGQVWIV